MRHAMTAAVLIAAGLAAPVRGQQAPPPTQPASRPAGGPGGLVIDRFRGRGPTDAGKRPVALLLCPEKEAGRFSEDLRGLLLKQGFDVLACRRPKGGWDRPDTGGRLGSLLRDLAKGPEYSGRRIVLVAATDAGPRAMSLIDRFAKRLAGAILISVTPLERWPSGIRLWAPRGEGWKVPLWSVVGTRPADAARTLLMWRQIASVAPKGASLTIDTRLGAGAGYARPDQAIETWLAAAATGAPVRRGPDRQAGWVRARHAKAAGDLLKAMRSARPAQAGASYRKRQAAMRVAVTAPKGWIRDSSREEDFHGESRPFVQIYLMPAGADKPLFARAMAARWRGSAAGLLDDYHTRLERKGYLVVRHHRWAAGGVTWQISSACYPTRAKWHRWLILSAAGPGREPNPAAPLLLVVDAAPAGDAATVAAAAMRLRQSLTVGRATAAKRKPLLR